MPDISKVIEIIFAGTDKVSGIVDSIGTKMDDMGSGLSDIAAPFETGTKAVLGLNAAIAGIALAAIAARSELESQAAKMQNALGLTAEETEKLSEAARNVYTSGFGESIAQSFEAATLAQQKFGDDASASVEKITTKALQLQETFGIDYAESLSTAKSLTDNFGISSSDAFDLIAKGLQDGLNGSGDFLDSIKEYAPQFANGKADAGQFFSILSSGFQEGILGTDKAGDAFKEFNIRILDGSKTTNDALKLIGLGDQFTKSLADGKISAIDAFDTVIEKLNATSDKSVVMQAGVGLIGTQFEDLGVKSALSLSTTKTKLEDITGTMDKMDFGNFSRNLSSAWRTAVDQVVNMDLWDDLTNQAGSAIVKMTESFKTAFSNYDFSEIEDVAEGLWKHVAGWFEDADLDLTTVEGMEKAINLVVETIESLMEVGEGIGEIFVPVVNGVKSAIETFNSFDIAIKELIGNVLGIGTALGTIGSILAAGGAVLGGVSSLASMLGAGGILGSAISALLVILTGPAGLVIGLGALSTAVLGLTFSKARDELEATRAAIEKETKTIDELTDQVNALPANVPTVEIYAKIEMGDYESAKKMIDEATAKQKVIDIKAQVEQKEFEDFYSSMVSLKGLTSEEIKLIASAKGANEAEEIIAGIAKERQVKIQAQVETEKATETLTYWTEQGGTIEIQVPVKTDKLEETKKAIEEIPSEKLLEIKLQGDIDIELARIETSAKTVQESFKYKAEVDVARAEAAATILKAQFESLGNSITSVSSSVSNMFSSLVSGMSSGELSQLEEWSLQRTVENQQAAQNALINSQTELASIQAEYMRAKLQAMQNGGSEIRIDSSGLEPALEMIMIEIFKKVQVWANEEASNFLFGIS